ncbi:hypothetical protein ES703_09101 [subsurface metagenome]
MNGELGVLSIDGRQIGGFLDWELDIGLREVSASSARQYALTEWNARAHRFWMLEIPDTNAMEALFYFYKNGKLLPASSNKVKVKLPSDYPLNTIINSTLEMV